MKLYCVTTEVHDHYCHYCCRSEEDTNMEFCTDKQIAEKVLKRSVCEIFDINNDNYDLFMEEENVDGVMNKFSNVKYYMHKYPETDTSYHTVECIHECVCSKYNNNKTYFFSIKEYNLENKNEDGICFSIKY